MKIARLLLFFSILLFSLSIMGFDNDLPKVIFKHWVHSYEEDTEDVKVFRPNYYNFPPSRGRLGFEIKENGEFIQYGIGPTDRLVNTYGHWKVEEKDMIIVCFDNKEVESYTINVVSCKDDVLRLKK